MLYVVVVYKFVTFYWYCTRVGYVKCKTRL